MPLTFPVCPQLRLKETALLMKADVIPGYQIKRLIGKGSMASVYLATQSLFQCEMSQPLPM